MKKMYALMVAGSLLVAGALSSPASARGHNYNNYRQAAVYNNYNRGGQQKGGPWVNAQIAANMQAAQNAQQGANYAASINPYVYGRNPYYGNYGGGYGNNYANSYAANGYYNSGGILSRFLGRY